MLLEDMGFPAITEERARSTNVSSPLQRCELVITAACNLKCEYCKGLSLEYGKTIFNFDAYSILTGWTEHQLKHASFSGGEPMYSPRIDEYVGMLMFGGVPFISLSTNGTFPIKNYENLVKLGATHFSISIDGLDAATGDKMSGVAGSWNKTVKTITQLSKCSYVTASTVFNEDNWKDAARIIEFIHSLGVADIRFSSASQLDNRLPLSLEQIPKEILAVHPILCFRTTNFLKGVNMRGNNTAKRCWLPLDDMVVSNRYHFPCTMQMREGGKYIGSILHPDGYSKTMTEIRQERAEWCMSHDIKSDNICQNYCMDFIIAYNNAVDKYKSI